MDLSQDQKKVYLKNLQKIEAVLNGEDYHEIAKEYEQVEIRKSGKSGRREK